MIEQLPFFNDAEPLPSLPPLPRIFRYYDDSREYIAA